jgi:hypothetical protein
MLKFKKLLASVLAVTSIFCIVACADVSTDNTTATTATTSGYTTIGPQAPEWIFDDAALEETVKNAPVILHVKFTEYEILETQNSKIYDLMWNCEVKDVLKGNLPEGTKEVKILDVGMTETPAVGAEYIAILEGEEVFVFTTEFSLRPISEKEKIKGYID